MPILFTVGDVGSAIDTVTGQPLPEMFLQATGNRGAAFALFFVGKHYRCSPECGLMHSAGKRHGVRIGLLASRLSLHLGVSSFQIQLM